MGGYTRALAATASLCDHSGQPGRVLLEPKIVSAFSVKASGSIVPAPAICFDAADGGKNAFESRVGGAGRHHPKDKIVSSRVKAVSVAGTFLTVSAEQLVLRTGYFAPCSHQRLDPERCHT